MLDWLFLFSGVWVVTGDICLSPTLVKITPEMKVMQYFFFSTLNTKMMNVSCIHLLRKYGTVIINTDYRCM